MSKFHLLEEFKSASPGEWPECKQWFSRFRTATKLKKEDGEVQVSSLIYAMGSEAENIFSSSSLKTIRRTIKS